MKNIFMKIHETPRLRSGQVRNNNSGISILLSILVLSSLMITTIAISDLVMRVSRSARQIGQAEIAYYATETAVEKALYEIEKNRDISSIVTSGTLSEFSGEADWSLTTEIITAENPYDIELDAGEQFQLELDFLGMPLPSNLNISWSGTGKVIVLYKDFTQEICDEPTCFFGTNNIFFLKIINNDSSTKTFSLTTSGNNLPLGIRVNASGTYKEQMRNLRVDRTNWQIY